MKLPGFLQRNKSDESAVPADLQQYYNTGQPSILKTILRVVAFLALLAILVWGGLWLFNKLTGNEKAVSSPTAANQQAAEETTEAQQDKAKADAEAQKKADEARKKAADEANKKIAAAQQKAAEAGGGGVSGGTTSSPTPTPAPTPAPSPAAGTPPPTTATLPNSGPGTGGLAAIFAGVSALGAFLHSLYMRRRSNA